jgi:hypothetical protein
VSRVRRHERPNTNLCSQCNFAASASARDIEKAKGTAGQSTITELGGYVLAAVVIVPIFIIVKIGFMSMPVWLELSIGAIGIIIWLFSKLGGKHDL